jgi:hypothetical protein
MSQQIVSLSITSSLAGESILTRKNRVPEMLVWGKKVANLTALSLYISTFTPHPAGPKSNKQQGLYKGRHSMCIKNSPRYYVIQNWIVDIPSVQWSIY